MSKEEQFKAALADVVDGLGATKDKPGFWILSGYSFKNDGEKIYVEMSKDQTKELVYIEIDAEQLLAGKILPKIN